MKLPAALIFLALLSSCSPWRYQRTEDKITVLGQSRDALSLTVDRVTAQFDIPRGAEVISCVDEPLDWNYVVTSTKPKFEFAVTLDKGADVSSLERYESYLKVIRDLHDPKVRMAAAAPFTLANGQMVTPYRYFSRYWGHRLVVKILEGPYTTTFEFSAPTEAELEALRPRMQGVISSFSYRSK